jgi:hypothetical protein
MLEIVARSDLHALIRCAAACKALRRDILCSSFIRRVKDRVAPCILAYVSTDYDKPFTLVHPATPAAMSLCHGHLFPFFLRGAADLFDEYYVKTSRRGLLLLHRQTIPSPSITNSRRYDSDRCSDLCVYDPMMGTRTFLPLPPEDRRNSITAWRRYVLLTAADGIGCSFQLFVADLDGRGIKVQSASTCGKWGHSTYVSTHHIRWSWKEWRHDPVVSIGRVIHWLVCNHKQILSYDLNTGKLGLVKLPPTNCDFNQ